MLLAMLPAALIRALGAYACGIIPAMSTETLIAKIIEIPLARLFILFLVFIVIICPGTLWLAVFKPELFNSTDTLRILLLSASISTPIFALNIIAGIGIWFAEFIDVRREEEKKASGIEDMTPYDPEGSVETGAGIGAIISLFPLYVPIIIRAFTNSLSLRIAVAIGVAIEVIVLAMMKYLERKTIIDRVRAHRRGA